MTRDDIIRMAREAGHAVRNIDGEDEVMDGDNYHIQTELIERFAELVAAAEREACAQVCEQAGVEGYGTLAAAVMIRTVREMSFPAIKQEPVAWLVYTLDGKSVCVTDNPADFTDQHQTLPLYTYPHQWQDLTEVEIVGLTCECVDDGTFNMDCALDFARAIEAKLKEKNT